MYAKTTIILTTIILGAVEFSIFAMNHQDMV